MDADIKSKDGKRYDRFFWEKMHAFTFQYPYSQVSGTWLPEDHQQYFKIVFSKELRYKDNRHYLINFSQTAYLSDLINIYCNGKHCL